MTQNYNPFPYYVWKPSYSDCIHYDKWRCKLTKDRCHVCLAYVTGRAPGDGSQCENFKAKEGVTPPQA